MEDVSVNISPERSSGDSNFSSMIRKRKMRLTFPPPERILESPNMRATVESNLYRIPDGSEALSLDSRKLERQWNNRFNITFSKDNNTVYTQLREYFDSPRKFDEGIPRKKNSTNRRTTKRVYNRTSSNANERESLWSTRYTASSEWNEVKHKSLRTYFDGHKLPKLNN